MVSLCDASEIDSKLFPCDGGVLRPQWTPAQQVIQPVEDG
jgi:hypothetical protein